MKQKALLITSITVLVLVLSACKKPAGEGGTASIIGKVYYNILDHNGDLIATEVARDEDVFILYGENQYADDDAATDPSGGFQFKYLRKGNYKVYAFQDCASCPSQLYAVSDSMEITEKGQVVELSDMLLNRILDLNDGNSTITARVVDAFNNPVSGKRVYIRYKPDDAAFDNEQTDVDGYVQFMDLHIGEYEVYIDDGGNKESQTAKIKENDEHKNLSNFIDN